MRCVRLVAARSASGTDAGGRLRISKARIAPTPLRTAPSRRAPLARTVPCLGRRLPADARDAGETAAGCAARVTPRCSQTVVGPAFDVTDLTGIWDGNELAALPLLAGCTGRARGGASPRCFW